MCRSSSAAPSAPGRRSWPSSPFSSRRGRPRRRAQSTAEPQEALPPLDSILPVDKAITIGRLPNGLTYYIRRNARPERRVLLRLAVKTGSVFEDDDQRGLAHMLEHMAFNGTAHFKPGELVLVLRIGRLPLRSARQRVYELRRDGLHAAGRDRQAGAGRQGTAGAGRLRRCDDARPEGDRQGARRGHRGMAAAAGRRSRILEKQAPVLYYKSRYAQRIPIGTPEILRTFSPARLRDFYETWYRPERMAVVVIGDIDPAVLEKSIASTFSSLADKRPPAPDPDRSVPEHAETLVNVAADPEGQATDRHAAAQDAGAAAEPRRRLPPRSRRAADVPAAEHPVRRAGAEAGRAVARGRRRQERHRRIHHGRLAWRARRGRQDRRRA